MRRRVIIKAVSAGIAAGFLALVKPENQPGMGVAALIGIAFYLINYRALSMVFPEKHYFTREIGDRYGMSRWAETKIGA